MNYPVLREAIRAIASEANAADSALGVGRKLNEGINPLDLSALDAAYGAYEALVADAPAPRARRSRKG